jgi:hypothetical protein
MAFTPMYNIHTPAADRNMDVGNRWGYNNNNQSVYQNIQGKIFILFFLQIF